MDAYLSNAGCKFDGQFARSCSNVCLDPTDCNRRHTGHTRRSIAVIQMGTVQYFFHRKFATTASLTHQTFVVKPNNFSRCMAATIVNTQRPMVYVAKHMRRQIFKPFVYSVILGHCETRWTG